MKKIVFIIIPALTVLLFFNQACKQSSKNQEEEKITNELKEEANKEAKNENATLFKIDNKVFSVPSPFQISYLVKKMDVDYNPAYMNSTKKLSRYQTDFKKAINLGIYGANLGYLNIYEQYAKAARYVAAVKELANQLGITSTFDKETIDRLERNSTNKDSLIHIISRVYRDADAYLMNNEQKDVAIFVIAGGWVESLYLLSKTAQEKPRQEIINRIAEQKLPLENVLSLLRPYYQEQSEAVDDFILSLTDLSSVFSNIKINYKYNDPKVVPSKKLTVVNSETEAEITKEQLNEIATKVGEIRNKLVE